jgi:outer membrane protein assembly factor BamB
MRFCSINIFFSVCFFCFLSFEALTQEDSKTSLEALLDPLNFTTNSTGIKLVNSTFLGGDGRNYYGNSAPEKLNLKWKYYLGKGKTTISRKLGDRQWAGAGWTGQPLLVKEGDSLFIIQGCYDHHLKKINAETGKLVWQYKFDDVVKGTGTIWYNKNAPNKEQSFIIFQGSRLGYGNYLDKKHIPSYRAISYITGKELWRLDVRMTDSYSRDVDGSCLMVNDTLYIGLENGIFTVIDPKPSSAKIKNGMLQPKIINEAVLYDKKDISHHRRNLVTESSPSKIGNHLYIASGSGHIYGYNLDSDSIDWDFYIGSDIDGSAIVTNDSCLLISVEKQYIEGEGGVFKLDPKKSPERCVEWYFPVKGSKIGSWQGGIIGSVGVNKSEENKRNLAAFIGVNGQFCIVEHDKFNDQKTVSGPNNLKKYRFPKLIHSEFINASISTPIFIKNKLVVAGYKTIRLYDVSTNTIKLLDKFEAEFESTPIVHNNKVYIASRNGNLYCLGD